MHQQGFSLIELLMGLAIAAIVLPWASAGYKELIASIDRKDTAQLLISGLRSARSEAITRNRTVVLRGIDNDWGRGWRITLDDKEKTVLMERRASARVVGNQPVKRRVRFGSQGEALHPSGAFQAGTLHVCAKRGPVSHHQVILAPSGRVRLESVEAKQALCEKGLKAGSARAALSASRT
ncbi:type IV fimbrial biogenesis protein FimT [Pseudomonas sp. NFACC15-1]|uniref:GspH/FimT family pseudopilin n=1 Tax=unclassified Pseudomonas TaxID=196821 RepID=UPI00088BA0E0|nr:MULTISPECIES: GspH/FimT family pseudopilin [unclassified Pseudomonas]SDA89077.1 type IV fimbrial biogenesis protein FimT [Pseudomonas sp. NFACC15-1]SDY91233.1 type IV fimbrial biogenesis protein FimT [Pseudomonas sp. NFACC14]